MRVWVAPPGWPTPPEGWSPPPGWRPDPTWAPAPDGWEWWQRQIDPVQLRRAARTLVIAILIWATGNLAVGIGLGLHARAFDHWFHQSLFGHGAPATSPARPFVARALVRLGLFAGAVALGVSWLRVFPRQVVSGVLRYAALGLVTCAVVVDFYLLWWGPFAADTWWGPGIRQQSNQMWLVAWLATAAAGTGAALAWLAARFSARR